MNTTPSDERDRSGGNVDPAEIEKFSGSAEQWWDPDGDARPLHDINPVRVAWFERQAGALAGRRILDVGCGGGILTEAIARRGADVVGIDRSTAAIGVARDHARNNGLAIEYRVSDAECLACEAPASFDGIACMELLEHVPAPEQVVTACATLLRPGGTAVFSTINRTPRAWLFAIVAAEYLLGVLPRGTHEYARLIRPAELAAWVRGAGLEVSATTGIAYNPLNRSGRLTPTVDINYMLATVKPPDGP